jgi:hypothetical protein
MMALLLWALAAIGALAMLTLAFLWVVGWYIAWLEGERKRAAAWASVRDKLAADAWRSRLAQAEAEDYAAGGYDNDVEAAVRECQARLPNPSVTWGRCQCWVGTSRGPERGWLVIADDDERAWDAVMPDKEAA